MTYSLTYFKCIIISLLLIQTASVFSQSRDIQNSETAQGVEAFNTQNTPTDSSVEQNNETKINEQELIFTDTNNQPDIELQGVGILDVLRILFVLVLLLVSGIGIVFFLKKIQSKQFSSGKDVIDLLSTKSISQGTHLHLLKVGNSYVLIANTNQNACLIKEFQNKEEIDELTLALSVAETQDQEEQKHIGFIQKLGKALQQYNIKTPISSQLANNKKKNTPRSSNYLGSILGSNNIFGGSRKT